MRWSIFGGSVTCYSTGRILHLHRYLCGSLKGSIVYSLLDVYIYNIIYIYIYIYIYTYLLIICYRQIQAYINNAIDPMS